MARGAYRGGGVRNDGYTSRYVGLVLDERAARVLGAHEDAPEGKGGAR